MATPDPDAPTQRILTVIEMIAMRGPITLPELCAALPLISRAAVWRAVDTLRAQGWVRMRAGDNAYEMRREMADRLARGHHSMPEVEAIAPIRDRIGAMGPVHVELGGFVDTGVFKVLESTRKSHYRMPQDQPSLVDDDLAIAAQLTVPPPNLVLHLRAYLIKARNDERQIITSGEHGRAIAKLRDVGYLWLDDRSAISISLPEFRGFALRAELWRVTNSDLARFSAQMTAFLDERRAKFPISVQIDYGTNFNFSSSRKHENP
jgi:hypothetical protein